MARSLERVLSLRDLTLLVIGAVIGSGIFIVPASVLSQTDGRIGVALLVWLVAGLLSLLGALTYGELSAADPQSGGIYVYIRDAFGHLPAFLYGWTLLFMIAGGAVATLAVAFTSYLSQIVPVSGVAAKLVSIAMIAVVMIINVRGTRQSSDIQNVTTAIKVGAILIMGAVLLISGDGFRGTGASIWPDAWSGSVFAGVLAAMIGVLWAYEGWQFSTFSAGEVTDAQRTFPRGIMLGTLALILIYCFANIAYIAALGPQRVAASEAVAADAVGALLGPLAGKLIAATILISMFSAANSILLTTPRVYYAMARDGIFFRKLAEVHPRFRTPAIAVIVQALWAMGLAATGTFNQLLTYVIFTGWIFYALGAASIFVLRRTRPDRPRPFKVPGYPYTPALFVISSAVIVINTLVTQPNLALVGLAFVLSGAPAFLIWRRLAPSGEPAQADEVAAGKD
jgi:APA family basic amino acid/polyamine antiporter